MSAKLPSDLVPRFSRLWTAARPSLAYLGVFTAFNLVLNVRYPGYESPFWYLVPSVDITCLLAVYALLAMRGIRVPTYAHAALVALLAFVRILRIADGIETFHFYRLFNLYIDLPLVPELVRLLFSAQGRLVAILVLLGVATAFVGLVFALSVLLRAAERLSASAANRRLLAIVVTVFLLLSPVRFERSYPERYEGAFAESVVPRLWDEASFLLNIYGHKTARMAAIDGGRRKLEGIPTNLSKLHEANVLILFVESYGQVVLDRPSFEVRMSPLYQSFDRDVGAAGFHVVSRILKAPTYGGSSWLAHATLATGVRTSDQWQYDLVRATGPKPLESFFHDAGYETVLVEPGTTRENKGPEFHRFDRSFFEWSMGYRGPNFSWAPMPDQYVLDFIHRSVLEPARTVVALRSDGRVKPVFLEGVLVSSHAPWNVQPPLVDWGDLGDGSIFDRTTPVLFDADIARMSKGADGYMRSIEYDFAVLDHFFTKLLVGDALVIFLGDHQPSPAITERSQAWGVPVHVLSRDANLVDPFRSHGYTDGMRPDTTAPPQGMETFLADFLRDFSR